RGRASGRTGLRVLPTALPEPVERRTGGDGIAVAGVPRRAGSDDPLAGHHLPHPVVQRGDPAARPRAPPSTRRSHQLRQRPGAVGARAAQRREPLGHGPGAGITACGLVLDQSPRRAGHLLDPADALPADGRAPTGAASGIRSDGPRLATIGSSSMPAPLTIRILGAGVSGLASALLLSADGHRVELIDERFAIPSVGTALALFPPAQSVLA